MGTNTDQNTSPSKEKTELTTAPASKNAKGAKNANKAGYMMDTNIIRELQKYMDILGGVYVLDYMPQGFLYNKIKERAGILFDSNNKNANKEKC